MTSNIVARSKTRYLAYEQRHQAILNAALRLFNARGYTATRIVDIAAEADVVEPVIYSHFENKKQLFIQCFESIEEELIFRFRAVEAKYYDDEINYIKGTMNAYLDFLMNDPNKSMYLIHMFSCMDEPEFRILIDRFMNRCISRIEREIDKAKQKGTISNPLSSRFLAGMLVVQGSASVLLRNYIDPVLFDRQNLLETVAKCCGID